MARKKEMMEGLKKVRKDKKEKEGGEQSTSPTPFSAPARAGQLKQRKKTRDEIYKELFPEG